MLSVDKFRILKRFVRLEGVSVAFGKVISGVVGLVFRFELAYVLVRQISEGSSRVHCRNKIVVNVLDKNQLKKLAMVAYCGEQEIERRLGCGQKCIIATLNDDIVHYSWLTSRQEYAGEVEMMIPVRDDEMYLYNCRTLRQARGCGVFPVIIERALLEARKLGVSCVIALVSRDNKSSLRSFEKMGFVIRQEIKLRKLFTFRKHKIRQINKS